MSGRTERRRRSRSRSRSRRERSRHGHGHHQESRSPRHSRSRSDRSPPRRRRDRSHSRSRRDRSPQRHHRASRSRSTSRRRDRSPPRHRHRHARRSSSRSRSRRDRSTPRRRRESSSRSKGDTKRGRDPPRKEPSQEENRSREVEVERMTTAAAAEPSIIKDSAIKDVSPLATSAVTSVMSSAATSVATSSRSRLGSTEEESSDPIVSTKVIRQKRQFLDFEPQVKVSRTRSASKEVESPFNKSTTEVESTEVKESSPTLSDVFYPSTKKVGAPTSFTSFKEKLQQVQDQMTVLPPILVNKKTHEGRIRQQQPFSDFKPRLVASRTRAGSKESDSKGRKSRSRSPSFEPFDCGNLLPKDSTQGSPTPIVLDNLDDDVDDPPPSGSEVSEDMTFTQFKESLSRVEKMGKQKAETSNVTDDVIPISDDEGPKESPCKKTPSKFNNRVSKLSLKSTTKSKGTRGLLKPELERLVKEQEETILKLTQQLEEERSKDRSGSRPQRDLKEMTTVQHDIKRQELVYALDASGLALDSNLQANILKDLITKPMPGGWGSLNGLTDVKRIIQEAVVWPIMRPDIFSGPRSPPKGIMLFGPPGTGKTMIARLIASECGLSYFFSISAATITSKWVGECEKTVRALFDIARVAGRSVIFLDEMESLLSTRTDKGHDSSTKMKTEFLIQLSNIMESDCNILFIGATNKPYAIDDAVRRRLEKRLYVPLPDVIARKHMLQKLLTDVDKVDLSEDDFDSLAARTMHFSGADLKTLVADSLNGPLRSLPAGTDIKNLKVEDIRPVSMMDFQQSLLHIKPSVNLKDVAEHEKFNKAYGCS